MVVGSRTQEANQVGANVFVAEGEFAKFGGGFHFGQGRRQVQGRETVLLWDIPE